MAEQVAFDRVNVHTARWLYDLESVLVAAEAIAPPDPRHAEERRPLARWRLEHVADPPFSSGHDLLAAARERLEMTLVEEAPGSIAPSPNARAPEIPARSAWWRPSSSWVAARPRARYRGRGTAFCGAAHRLIVRVSPAHPSRRSEGETAELSAGTIAALCAATMFAGAMDAVGGGGGLVTVPALLAAGLPPHLALGTNRGQSVFGSFAALSRYAHAG